MTITVQIQAPAFANARFNPAANANVGDQVQLLVDATLQQGQEIVFELRDSANADRGVVALLKATQSGASYTANYTVPNEPGGLTLVFDAVLRSRPSPANGHLTVSQRATSGTLAVQGFTVETVDAGSDAFFAPKSEQLNLKYRVTDAGGQATKGRFEVWGERYSANQPLYTSDIFTPAAGETTWTAWDGLANGGPLNGHYISPDFSPYRLKVVIGMDEASVRDPVGAGRGKVSVASRFFEVAVQSVSVRLQTNVEAAVATELQDLLAIEPRAVLGTFAATGRLPTATPAETARIRIPCHRHQRKADSLYQASDAIGGAYGQQKWDFDKDFYVRPEIPVEFEPRLKSRTAATNAAPSNGVFVPEAVGKLVHEVFVNDEFEAARYTTNEPSGGTAGKVYFANSDFKVKRGRHDHPYPGGVSPPPAGVTAPQITYWQERFVVAADGVRDFNTTEAYATGHTELTIYLNRKRLVLGTDYAETNANSVRLGANLTTANDVVWIMRKPASPPSGEAIANWVSFPPGTNCHDHYGGIRGTANNNALKKSFSAGSGARRPLGKGTQAFPFTAGVHTDPDRAGATSERVECWAIDAGPKQGLAGIIFSPSYVGGDRYSLEVAVHRDASPRTLGFVDSNPVIATAKTGTMAVWRLVSITRSIREPLLGTAGLLPTVGTPNEPPLPGAGAGARAYIGDGIGLRISTMNTELESTFTYNEWQVTPLPAAGQDFHNSAYPNEAAMITAYIGVHDGAEAQARMGAGKVKILTANRVQDRLVQTDPYRVALPPIPPTPPPPAAAPANYRPYRRNVTNALAALVSGSTAAQAVTAANNAMSPPAAPAGNSGTPIYAGTDMDYFWENIVGPASDISKMILKVLTPPEDPPRSMKVFRWVQIHDVPSWKRGAVPFAAEGLHLAGESQGNSQSIFVTGDGDGNTFAHEMGHSLNLVHFIAGNFAWKHHDHNFFICKMSYDSDPSFQHFLRKPAHAVGANATFWPNVDGSGNQGIQFGPLVDAAGTPFAALSGASSTANAAEFCAKCRLKLRGWKETVLPANWAHPDLF